MYNYIIFKSTTGFSLNTYVGTIEDANTYMRKYAAMCNPYIKAGRIALSTDEPISEFEQELLLAEETI